MENEKCVEICQKHNLYRLILVLMECSEEVGKEFLHTLSFEHVRETMGDKLTSADLTQIYSEPIRPFWVKPSLMLHDIKEEKRTPTVEELHSIVTAILAAGNIFPSDAQLLKEYNRGRDEGFAAGKAKLKEV